MGIAGLRILLYAARVHTDIFRGIILEQNKLASVGTGHDYPVAVASINVANFLMQMFGQIVKQHPNQLIPIFFDHAFAFEEMCTRTLAYLDKVLLAPDSIGLHCYEGAVHGLSYCPCQGEGTLPRVCCSGRENHNRVQDLDGNGAGFGPS